MKFKLTIPHPMAALFAALAMAVFSTVTAIGQDAAKPGPPARNTIDPDTGLPISSGTVDPTTGLPVPWKDGAWVDPDKVLPEIKFDGLPVEEIARSLRDVFKGAFDVLLPDGGGDRNWRSEPVFLELKNVRASEVFNAMNMLFENNRTPLRWELKLNGQRQIALLRVLEEPKVVIQPKREEPKRNIFFVGDLIKEKSGFPTVQQLVQTVSEIFDMSYPYQGPRGGFGARTSAEVIRFHEGAQLLIVTGSQDQIQFVGQTLSALRDKARMAQITAESNERESKPKSPDNKPQPGEKPH